MIRSERGQEVPAVAFLVALLALPAIALLLAMAARVEHLLDDPPRAPQR